MITFLPLPNFEASCKVLDRQRLGKQRSEALTLLRTLTSNRSAWKNHPATKMWRGYEDALEEYLRVCIIEWVSRGYANSIPIPQIKNFTFPSWMGDNTFHASHRSNLLRKDAVWYGKFGWTEQDNLPYIWP